MKSNTHDLMATGKGFRSPQVARIALTFRVFVRLRFSRKLLSGVEHLTDEGTAEGRVF
jgi:hypothetical protein